MGTAPGPPSRPAPAGSGPEPFVRQWRAAALDRIIPAVGSDPPASIRAWAATDRVRVLGELSSQYGGMAPADSAPAAYFALAEEPDLPVAVHVGLGPPGAPLGPTPRYRMRLSDPLLL